MKRLVERLWRVQAVRILAIAGVLYFFVFQICSERFWRDPHSAFFNSDHVYDLDYSAQRRTQADQYIRIANTTANSPEDDGNLHRAGEGVLLCGAYVTVKRPGPVFAEAIGSMLMNLTQAERNILYLFTLFANPNPNDHPDWEKPWVNTLIDEVKSYDVDKEQLESLREWEDNHDWQRKGLFDYAYALRKCYNTQAPFVAVFEDDIIFAEGWLAKTIQALEELTTTRDVGTWIYLRLFFTETAMMWSNRDFWYRNMWLAFGIGISVATGLLMFVRRKMQLTTLSIAVISLVVVPAFVALIFMVGKYSLAPMEGVVPMDIGGCCTQAMVYPRSQVPGLIEYLGEINPGQTDTLIENYANDKGLKRFALAPQVVQHVGRQSSRDNSFIDTRSVWAFHFEASHRQTLHEEHEELAAELAKHINP